MNCWTISLGDNCLRQNGIPIEPFSWSWLTSPWVPSRCKGLVSVSVSSWGAVNSLYPMDGPREATTRLRVEAQVESQCPSLLTMFVERPQLVARAQLWARKHSSHSRRRRWCAHGSRHVGITSAAAPMTSVAAGRASCFIIVKLTSVHTRVFPGKSI